MFIPEYVKKCLDRLENAGFSAYIVGGCVRDAGLGITPQDYDMCTSALPEQTEALFSDHHLVLAGKKHGTVGVVTDGGVVEITTFRTEGGYADNRHPEWVEFVPNVEDDLARRDFTVNAMAYSPVRGFADPFDGQSDLEHKILRAVGNPDARFQEDSLRILRGVRFAVKYHLTPEEETLAAMFRRRNLMDNLARERIFEELSKLLPLVNSEDLLRFAPVITAVIPELEPTIGYDQRNPNHAYDLYKHIACVTAATAPLLHLRWAGLLHDVGKIACFSMGDDGIGHFYGHDKMGAAMADTILSRLKAPTALRERVVQLIGLHMTRIPPERKTVRRWMSRLGYKTLADLLTFQLCDTGSKGTSNAAELQRVTQIRQLMADIQSEDACLSLKDLAVNGNDLIRLGFSGKEIGKCLSALLDGILDEQLPNDRTALLQEAEKILSK